MKRLLFFFLIIILLFYHSPVIKAETSQADLEKQIAEYQAKLTELSGQKQTLSQALSVLNTQIKLTEAKIAAQNAQISKLEIEITDLSGKIESLDYSLTDLTRLFVARVRESYKYRNQFPTLLISQSTGLNGLVKGVEYIDQVRDHDRSLLIALEKSRLTFDTQKSDKEVKQSEIVKLKAGLDREKAALASQISAKNKLLADTKNDETKYQQLLSSAQRQLAAFRRFASSQGGATLLNNQTKCDDWGCYYNQRDSAWGNQTIGLSSETMREVGCLITSMAMVASHYGKSIKPGDIAGSSNPFWGNTAYMNQGSWTVGGVTMSRTRLGSSTAKIDEELAAGRPVVVGIYGGPDHFLVITKKEGDDYMMMDPFPENGGNIKFTSKYPLSAISAVDRVTVN